jgi:hypothetical protein
MEAFSKSVSDGNTKKETSGGTVTQDGKTRKMTDDELKGMLGKLQPNSSPAFPYLFLKESGLENLCTSIGKDCKKFGRADFKSLLTNIDNHFGHLPNKNKKKKKKKKVVPIVRINTRKTSHPKPKKMKHITKKKKVD